MKADPNDAGKVDIRVRQAKKTDCLPIAMLCLNGSYGLAEAIWSQLQVPDKSLLDVGVSLCERDDVIYSYRNCMVAEYDGEVAGMFHSYVMQASAGDGGRQTDPIYKQFFKITEFDCSCLFISLVAVYPNFQHLGVGARLLECAQQKAASLGLPRLGLMCFEDSPNILEMMIKWGFKRRGRSQIIPHDLLHYRVGNAVMLIKEL